MALIDILNSFTGNSTTEEHFDRVAEQASTDELGSGLAAAMRSDQTPPFGSMVGQLFGHSNASQQAGLLNQILSTLGPTVLSGAAGGVLGRMLGSRQGPVTSEQASQVTPAQVTELAAHAEQAQPGVVDQVSRFYAEHSGLIKTLGGAALAITLASMKNNAERR